MSTNDDFSRSMAAWFVGIVMGIFLGFFLMIQYSPRLTENSIRKINGDYYLSYPCGDDKATLYKMTPMLDSLGRSLILVEKEIPTEVVYSIEMAK